MKTKNVLTVSVVACSLLLLTGCGGTKKADVSTGAVTTINENVQTTGVANTKPATKDQCIELMAYAFKFAQLQAQGDTTAITTWAQKANDLEVKYRAAGLEYEQACNKLLSADINFMQVVQKRVAELK
ncbi:MAG: hypothetical protein WC606_01120 [Candidatus Absconditabacterales bacterium]